LAGAIEKAFGDKVTVNQKTGSGGVFDVIVDDDKIFSKHEQFRFPDNKEILQLIQGRLK